VNHTRFPEGKHLPYWARRGNKDKKDDRVEGEPANGSLNQLLHRKWWT